MKHVDAIALCILLALLPGVGLAADGEWVVGLRRVGPIRMGMALDEVSASIGELRQLYEGDGSCYSVAAVDGPKGLSFMVMDGRIVRADIDGEGIKTLSGGGVGDTETVIQDLYPGQIEVTGHAYTAGHYLYFRPKDAADRRYGLVFETEDGVVVRYRSGLVPFVNWVEGCS